MKYCRTPFIFSLCALVASCGGGGQEAACSSETVLSISVKWNSNGILGANVVGKIGVPLIAQPVITGIPQSCLGQESFSSGIGFPASLSLDGKTGVISGTPQTVGSAGSSLVKLKLPGYTEIGILSNVNISH